MKNPVCLITAAEDLERSFKKDYSTATIQKIGGWNGKTAQRR